MKRSIALALIVAAAGMAAAQEQVPQDETQRIAEQLIKSAAAVSDAPLKIEVDAHKPRALRAGSVAVLVVPAEKLSEETLANNGKAITPLGQLWMYRLALAPDGKATPRKKLRLVKVTQDDREYKLPLFLLATQKDDEGKIRLLVYGKGHEPLTQALLEKSEGPQEFPIELQGRKTNDSSGILTLNILGKYKADLALMKQPD